MADDPNTRGDHPRARRPGVRKLDVPSKTVGLPGIGEEASAAHFARDAPQHLQQAEAEDEPTGLPPAGPRDRTS